MHKLYAKLKKNKRPLTGNATTNEMILWVTAMRDQGPENPNLGQPVC